MASLFAVIVSLAATAISAFFALSVLQQYREKRKAHQLVWTFGLGGYAFASFLQALAEGTVWTVGVYKAYYVSAAALVFLLGLGAIYLLSRRAGHAGTVYFLVLLVLLSGLMIAAGVNEQVLAMQTNPGGAPLAEGDNLARAARSLALLFTIPGSLALIGIALYALLRYRLMYNLAIALGAVVVALGGLAARLNEPAYLYLTQFVGIAIMYSGFVKSLDVVRPAAQTAAASE
jgi:hypothetical protein